MKNRHQGAHASLQQVNSRNSEHSDNMIKQAEAHKEEDQKRKEAIEEKNHLDSQVNNVEKSLNEHKSKLNQNDVEEIE